MTRFHKSIALILLAGAVVAATVARAATSSTIDILPDSAIATPAEPIELGKLKPLPSPRDKPAAPRLMGNPLWGVPLSALTATQERPIFSASRRPPPRAIAGPPVQPVSTPMPPPVLPEVLQLVLIGAVVGDRDAIAIFLDRTNQAIVRLRSGQSHAGWVLESVERREVTLKKADRTEVLLLQRFEGGPGLANLPPPAIVPGSPNSFAPFVPRSTPKNGESDGL